MPEIDDEQAAETSETPEEEQDETPDSDDTGTPDEDTNETEDEGEDSTEDEDEGDEDIDEDEGLPDSVRQLRAALRTQGYTFDEAGNPVAPENPVASAGEIPAQATETPAETVETPVIPPLEHPAEFQGFSVRADGMDLFDLAYEDPTSDDAQGLIHGTEDQDGNIITEGIGEAAYVNLLHKYNRAKDAYAHDFDTRVEAASAAQLPAFRTQIETARASARTYLEGLDDAQAAPVLEAVYTKANQVIKDHLEDRTAELVATGVTARRAALIANKEVFDNPAAYETALGVAIVKDVKGFVKGLTEAIKGGTPKPAAPGTPPRPAVPSVSRPGSGSSPAPGTTAAITPSREEREMARMRGLTSTAEITKYVRDLRQYTKA